VNGDASIIQTAVNNMRTVYGEIWNDGTRGNMISSRRLKLNGDAMRQVEFDCRNAILNDARVADVPWISATRTSGYECSVAFTIKKHDGSLVNSETLVVVSGV
jgi:hypothetical protein